MDEFREDRFTIQPGDFVAERAQCADCAANPGGYECDEYGTKPDAYLFEGQRCPRRRPEQPAPGAL